MAELIRTPLYEEHVKLGGKMVEYAGYEMPVRYSNSISDEHLAVRNGIGVFDLTHMGEIRVKGKGARELVSQLGTNNRKTLKEPYQVQYSSILNDKGTILDDMLVYRFDKGYMLVVNGANQIKIDNWLKERFDYSLVDNQSYETSLIAIQGPQALDFVAAESGFDPHQLKYYTSTPGTCFGVEMLISRTGYTGEKGVELYMENDKAAGVWQKIFETGEKWGVRPIGLAARDTLRLEMRYSLYGHELDETINPIEAGIGWVVKPDKNPDFIGRDAIVKILEQGITRTVVGLEGEGKQIPRQDYPILSAEGEEIGHVTSGTLSPVLEKPIALGYVKLGYEKPGTKVKIRVRKTDVDFTVVETPFVNKEKKL